MPFLRPVHAAVGLVVLVTERREVLLLQREVAVLSSEGQEEELAVEVDAEFTLKRSSLFFRLNNVTELWEREAMFTLERLKKFWPTLFD